jgi:hypothetical protein
LTTVDKYESLRSGELKAPDKNGEVVEEDEDEEEEEISFAFHRDGRTPGKICTGTTRVLIILFLIDF